VVRQPCHTASLHYSIYKPPHLAILPVPMTILINILLGFYVFIALLMVLVILMQRPKSEGLGAAFGGGVTENIFGAQTTNVLTKITSWLAALFFLLTFVLSILYAQKSSTKSGLQRELMKDLPPAISPTPGPSPTAAAGATPTASPGPSPTAAPDGTVSNSTPAAKGPSPSVKPMAPISTPADSASPTSSPGPSATPAVPAKRRPRR
jgi:preprotein translocase subunit SecG